MSKYIMSGNTVKIVPDGSMSITDKLLPDMYFVKYDNQTHQFYLERGKRFKEDQTAHGNTVARTEKIIRTYLDRAAQGVNTGVLLSGMKGSGKTFQGKHICNKLITEYKIPTILITETYKSSDLALYLKDITEQCCIFFEEFEKMYKSNDDMENQNGLLTLLDGVMNSNKLFIFTCNEESDINSLLLNRPGRVWYHFKYSGLEDDVIESYCAQKLHNKKHIEGIKQVSEYLAYFFTFDVMKCLVEEINRYDITPFEALKELNITSISPRQFYKLDVHWIDPEGKPKLICSDYNAHISSYLVAKHCLEMHANITSLEQAQAIDKVESDECQHEMTAASDTFKDWQEGDHDSKDFCRYYLEDIELTPANVVKTTKSRVIYEKHGICFEFTKEEPRKSWDFLDNGAY